MKMDKSNTGLFYLLGKTPINRGQLAISMHAYFRDSGSRDVRKWENRYGRFAGRWPGSHMFFVQNYNLKRAISFYESLGVSGIVCYHVFNLHIVSFFGETICTNLISKNVFG